MELRHLRYFVAVAEELHFRRAAARLHVAQPGLSQQIQQLERELAVQLLHRTRRLVTLTEAGNVFLDRARATLAHADDAVRSAQRASRGEIGELTIGFVGSAVLGILPRVLKTFRMRFRAVELSLRELTTSQQIARLQNGQIDIGFLRPPVDVAAVATRIVENEPWVIAMPRSHRLAGAARLRLGRLAREPFVATPRALGPGFYDQMLGLCRRSGFTPNVVQEAVQMETIVGLVAAGFGVALVPRSVQEWSKSDVIFKALVGSPTIELAIAWRVDDDRTLVRQFAAVVKEFATLMS